MVLSGGFSIRKQRHGWKLSYRSRPHKKMVGGKLTVVTTKDKWYFPTLELTLKKYIDQSLNPSKKAKEILAKLEELNKQIEKFAKAYETDTNF